MIRREPRAVFDWVAATVFALIAIGAIEFVSGNAPKDVVHLRGPNRSALATFGPLAALAAVVAPEIFMTQGHLIATFKDARIYATLAATAYFFWRRGILGTIVTGTLVMVALRAGLGW